MNQNETDIPRLSEVIRHAVNTEDERALFEVIQQYSMEDMWQCFQQEPTLFHQICAKGLLSMAQFFMQAGNPDLTIKLEGRTPLQWACLRGHLGIVQLLLTNSILEPKVWQDNSEFYSASLGGHIEIIRCLFHQYSYMVKEDEMRTALLYAACSGGNIDVAKFWLIPGMDVNKPVELVSALRNCELMVPMYAACEGSHSEIALLLMELFEGELTKHIVDTFPEFTEDLVNSLHHPVRENENETGVSYVLQGSGVHLIHRSWLLPLTNQLTTVKLRRNKIVQLDSCLPWSMPNLVRLDVSENALVKFQGPAEPAEILCQRLEEMDLSNNVMTDMCEELFHLSSLTSLNLSYNRLQRLTTASANADLTASTSSLSGPSKKPVWRCSNLFKLDVSNNSLDVIPLEIMGCQGLKHLDVSYNSLSSLPSAWACSLEYLNASNNNLERFPPSTEDFWKGSLVTLLLQHNELDQLRESIVKLGMLQKLDISYNHVEFVVAPEHWDCPSLTDLNLSHNRLGVAQRRPTRLDFPTDSLVCLNLSDNDLHQLPLSVCYMKNLATLDISNNPLKDLPQEMGRLTNCWDLKLQGLNIQKHSLRNVIQTQKAQDVIVHLRNQLRKVQTTSVVKTLVLGPPGKGKSTVIRTLVKGNMDSDSPLSDKLITTTVFTFKHRDRSVRVEGRKDSDRPDVTLRIWELPGASELMAVHPVLWTEYCLFLLVWDTAAGANGLDHWLCSIKARLDKASVVIVGTMCDRIPALDVASKKEHFHRDVNRMYGQEATSVGIYPKEDHKGIYPHLSNVVLVGLGSRQWGRQDVSHLKSAVYLSAISFTKMPSTKEFLVGQKLPQSYLKVDEALNKRAEKLAKDGQPPFLTQAEFDELISSIPDTDFKTFDDLPEAINAWRQMGSLLHFDVWSEGLENLYFLDPDWIVCMIATVLLPSRGSLPHRQTLSSVEEVLTSNHLPPAIFKQFLQLLKHFDIGAVITEQEQNLLLLPCRLPREAPGLQLHKQQYGRMLLRFYSLPHVPARLWSRLILGLLLSKERFQQSRWFLGAQPSENPDPTFHSSRRGFQMQRLHMMYWQSGLSMTFDGGSVVMETCEYRTKEQDRPGILISITSTTPSLSNLGVVGFVSDELDAAIQNIFPHHQDDPELLNVFALCPVCHSNVEPGQGLIKSSFLHFELRKCAAGLLQGDFALCSTGCKVPLEELVPEFLFTELPRKFHLRMEDIKLTETRLGGGAAGSVYKGTLRGEDIAVKVFYSSDLPTGNFSPSRDSGVSSVSSAGSQSSTGRSVVSVGALAVVADCVIADGETATTPAAVENMLPQEERFKCNSVYGNFAKEDERFEWLKEDHLESRSLKICRAFFELRQEVAILSKLRHPCILALHGVCVRPNLLIAIELAPFGSLRSVLKAEMSKRPPFNKYTDRDKIFGSVLKKEITFKIVFQVASGLHYLHKHKILYRDLKTDNVLICSLEPSEPINIKISDYGISKFATPQGMMGMVGTPGYMAPEIMKGQAYDEKVDIFSFAMVIYETLTGHPPFESYPRLHQLHYIINSERRRPLLREYNVVPCFPYLEFLIQSMWEHEPSKRPAAQDIRDRMQDVSFLLQHAYIKAPEEPGSGKSSLSLSDSLESCLFCNVTCAWASQEMSVVKNRNTCWIWEFPTELPKDRRLSVYNLVSNQFHIHCKSSPGLPVTCMAKVGSCMWVGVKGRLIEIFGNSCTDIPRCQNQLSKLQAEPTCIIHDRHNPRKPLLEGEGFVYVGLSNGSISVYEHHRWHRNDFTSEWRLRKELTLSTTQPVSAMCLVVHGSKHELWVGCGHVVVVVSTENFLVEKRLCVKKELAVPAQMLVSSIACMVRAEHKLWCSFKCSPLIVEFNVLEQTASCAFCLESDIMEVYVSEVKLQKTPDCRECEGSRQRHLYVNPYRPRMTEQQDELPPARPPRSTTLLASSASGKTDSSSRDLPPAPNLKFLSLPRDMPSGSNEPPPPLPPRPPKPNKLKAFLNSKGDTVADAETEHPPQVSPRQQRPASTNVPTGSELHAPLSNKLSSTMPNISVCHHPVPPLWEETGPPVPPRRSLPSEHDGVHVQSLLIARGMLWVGTSEGEILLINTQESGHTAAESRSAKHEAFARTSMNIESGQTCSLKPVTMAVTRASVSDSQSGGVHILLQAHNLVMAVRNMCQEIAEVAIWEECSYEKITEIRRYWQSLRELKSVVEKADSVDFPNASSH